MATARGAREARFWCASAGAKSPVSRDLAKLPKDVQAHLIDKTMAYVANPSAATPPKPLRHVGRIAEYIYQGPHGHFRLLLIDMTDYVLLLDVFKKQGNTTDTKTAVSRLAEWNKWH